MSYIDVFNYQQFLYWSARPRKQNVPRTPEEIEEGYLNAEVLGEKEIRHMMAEVGMDADNVILFRHCARDGFEELKTKYFENQREENLERISALFEEILGRARFDAGARKLFRSDKERG